MLNITHDTRHKKDESGDLSTNDYYVAVSGVAIHDESDSTHVTILCTNEASWNTPVKTNTNSADPKTEPGCMLDGETASVDEALFDIRCSRDTLINEKSDKDCPCCDSGKACEVHEETSVCS